MALVLHTSVVHASSPRMFGVNMSGGEFGTGTGKILPGNLFTDYWYPRIAELDWAKSQGLELIRVPFRWERIQHETNGVLDVSLWAPDIAQLDAVLNEAEARGLRVILDMHNFAGRYFTINGTYANHKIGSAQLPVSEYARAWRLLADHYKNRKCIWGYDIMNEPVGVTLENWVTYCQAAVNAIREVDTSHAIILEGVDFTPADRWLTKGAALIAVTDPSNNLIFSAHCYPDYDQDGEFDNGGTVTAELVRSDRFPDLASALNVGVNRVKPFVDWCVANNVRGLVGEYGVHQRLDTANWDVILQRMLTYMRDNSNGLVSGTQWGGGGWSSLYAMRMTSRVDNTEPPFMPTTRSFASGIGTQFWPNFVIYDDNFVSSGFTYKFASQTPAATCTFVATDATTPYRGSKSALINYTIPSGGYAGGGMHIQGPSTSGGIGGISLVKSVQAGHVLIFYARGTPGANPSITIGSTANASGVDTSADTATGNWISLGSIAPLTETWQRYEIPLSAFFNAQVNADTRIQRLRINGAPANNTSYNVWFDSITLGLEASNVAPTVTVNTSTGSSTAQVGETLTFVSTATDANAGDSIDYTEFYSNNEKIGVDDTAPYQIATSFSAPGTKSVTAIAFDSHGIVGVAPAKVVTVSAGTLASFRSLGTDDGYVVESTETSNLGGSVNVASTIQVGDTSTKQQIKSILSFDTSAIPDTATILSATLKIKRSSLAGTNPFATHGACNVSIKYASYSGNDNLVVGDFSAVNTATDVATLSNPTADNYWSTATISATGRNAINKTGKTQLRLQFAIDDNNDTIADTLKFYSGNDATVSNRPLLEIVYQ